MQQLPHDSQYVIHKVSESGDNYCIFTKFGIKKEKSDIYLSTVIFGFFAGLHQYVSGLIFGLNDFIFNVIFGLDSFLFYITHWQDSFVFNIIWSHIPSTI